MKTGPTNLMPPLETAPGLPAGMTEQARRERPSRWVLIPPPPLFFFPLALSARLGHVIPLPLMPVALRRPVAQIGIGVIVLGLAFIVSATFLFLRGRTTIVPHGTARSMIVRGAYRISRNPMYVGLTIAYLGVTLMMASGWPLLFLAFPLWVIHSKTIPFEEQQLARTFGDDYLRYQRRVRRWI